MDGSLSLQFGCVDGRTRPIRAVAVPPLQCSRARYDDPCDPGMANMTLLHLGGVLQGDRLAMDITLEQGATTRITTAAATQVYRMPEREASQSTVITLHPGARLHYLPEPTILFAESRFSQSTRITLHEGAALVLRELLVSGRLARGEQHQYERFRSQFEVYDERGRCLMAERALIEPACNAPTMTGIQASYPVVGSVYFLATGGETGTLLRQTRQALQQHQHVLAEAGSLPNDCGVLVRALGITTQAVRAALESACQQVCIGNT